MKKNQNGITLIALVITIIVLLILAGVSIAMLTGDNGILTKAGTARDESALAEVKEAVSLAIAEIYANKNDTVSGAKNGPTTLTAENIATIAIKNNSSLTKNGTGSDNDGVHTIKLTLNSKNYTVTYTEATTTTTDGTTTTTPASITATLDETT